jgi:hypothetical protein
MTNRVFSLFIAAVDEQALAGAFLAYQLHQRALCETICERQVIVLLRVLSCLLTIL